MQKVQIINKTLLGTIKSKRNKVMKTLDQYCNAVNITKVMTFSCNEELMWLQNQILERLDLIRSVKGLSYYDCAQKGYLEALIKETSQYKVVYLTKRYITGLTVLQVIAKQGQVERIIKSQNSENIKKIILQIMALLIGGYGHKNIIITLQNLIFEQLRQEKGERSYRMALNILSFAGIRLLKLRKDITREEYYEIGIFLDQQSLKSGNLDRFEFKARNFAILILALLCRKDPSEYVFQTQSLEAVIDLSKARQLFQNIVTPRLNRLMEFKSLKNAFIQLNIKGLEEFVFSALNYPQQHLDWSQVHKMLISNKDRQWLTKTYKIPTFLWEKQQQWIKQLLKCRGMGLSQNGSQVYAITKISTYMESLLQYNDWKDMLITENYNLMAHQTFYRLLKATIPKNIEDHDIIQQIIQLSKSTFHTMNTIDNREIYAQSYIKGILHDYQF